MMHGPINTKYCITYNRTSSQGKQESKPSAGPEGSRRLWLPDCMTLIHDIDIDIDTLFTFHESTITINGM